MTDVAVPRRAGRFAWRKRGALPRLDELPIPRDVKAGGPGWTEQMREMADHIGAWATLTIIAAQGGQWVYVPSDPASNPFRGLVDQATVEKITAVYRGNRIQLPVGRAAVNRARRAVVLAAVRANKITGADAQKIIGTSRTYLSHLRNHTDEGVDAGTRRIAEALPMQPDLFSALPRD